MSGGHCIWQEIETEGGSLGRGWGSSRVHHRVLCEGMPLDAEHSSTLLSTTTTLADQSNCCSSSPSTSKSRRFLPIPQGKKFFTRPMAALRKEDVIALGGDDDDYDLLKDVDSDPEILQPPSNSKTSEVSPISALRPRAENML